MELLYADDLTSEIMEDVKERFGNWKDARELKSLKDNITKTKVMSQKENCSKAR